MNKYGTLTKNKSLLHKQKLNIVFMNKELRRLQSNIIIQRAGDYKHGMMIKEVKRRVLCLKICQK